MCPIRPITPSTARSRPLHTTAKAIVPSLLLLLPMAIQGGERPETWQEVFAYCQETSVEFGTDGNPVVLRRAVKPPPPPDPAAPPFDPDRMAANQAANGDPQRAETFLTWLDKEYAEAGETVLVAGTDAGGVYVLTEHGALARGLRRYDMATKKAVWLTAPGDTRELVGPLFLADGNGGTCLAGLVWNSPEGTRTEWRDPAMDALQTHLEKAFPGAGFDWLAPSPDGGSWIVRARHRDRPSTWLAVDVSAASWRVLAECPVEVTPTKRTLFHWTASDGMSLSGVFTRPDGPGPHPLVVFPHGGPGALSTTDFDERVWALADAGFAVFQPNYRGSAGFGKAFRLAGWGAEGIRRALLDVREGTAALLADSSARLDGAPPVLFGGSWGGYVALEELAMFPGEWAGAVSFFGTFDLPELLRAEWARAGEGTTAAETERTRRSLRRQFGDPASPANLEALGALSPVNFAASIRAPVILFHNRADRVIAFEQSERMAEALQRAGVPVQFHAGDGSHGWSPAEEAALYATLARNFRRWIAPPPDAGRKPAAPPQATVPSQPRGRSPTARRQVAQVAESSARPTGKLKGFKKAAAVLRPPPSPAELRR